MITDAFECHVENRQASPTTTMATTKQLTTGFFIAAVLTALLYGSFQRFQTNDRTKEKARMRDTSCAVIHRR